MLIRVIKKKHMKKVQVVSSSYLMFSNNYRVINIAIKTNKNADQC